MGASRLLVAMALAFVACRDPSPVPLVAPTSASTAPSAVPPVAATASAAMDASAPAAASASASAAPDDDPYAGAETAAAGQPGADYGAYVVTRSTLSPADAADIRARAVAIVHAIATKSFAVVARAAHPRKGVRFSKYGEVDEDHDPVLTADQLRGAWTSGEVFAWSSRWAEDRPLRETLPKYYAEFLYNAPYERAQEITVDHVVGWGSLMYGDVKAYPRADIVDFHVRGKSAGASDWRSLRVVLEREGAERWLVGLVECEWTP